jgi:phage tail-like protein
LKNSTEVVEWRTAVPPGILRRPIAPAKYAPITLQQGLTHDVVFDLWANLVNNGGRDYAALVKYRKNLVINVLNPQGTVAMSCKVFRAWVSEFQAQLHLDAHDVNTVVIQTLRIEHEGWQRDSAVGEPTET